MKTIKKPVIKTKNIKTKLLNDVLYVTLNRTTQNNAFDSEMISTLTTIFTEAKAKQARFIFLTGTGKHFCTGADLRWMRHCAQLSATQNYAEAEKLYLLYLSMQQCELPIIAEVKGAIMGGGIGLCAAADIVLANDNSQFALSETQRGIVPAIMMPVLLKKMRASRILELLMTGRSFTANEALQYGLIHFVANGAEIKNSRECLFQQLQSTAPNAVFVSRQLLDTLSTPLSNFENEHLKKLLVATLAQSRASLETQEGIAAFFAKRKPQWHTLPQSTKLANEVHE